MAQPVYPQLRNTPCVPTLTLRAKLRRCRLSQTEGTVRWLSRPSHRVKTISDAGVFAGLAEVPATFWEDAIFSSLVTSASMNAVNWVQTYASGQTDRHNQ